MVYQMPCPDKAHVFAASSVDDEEQARQEVQAWASGNGYRIASMGNTFTVFGGGSRTREWVLLERARAKS